MLTPICLFVSEKKHFSEYKIVEVSSLLQLSPSLLRVQKKTMWEWVETSPTVVAELKKHFEVDWQRHSIS